MTHDLSLAKETEQFSFIDTIDSSTVDSQQNITHDSIEENIGSDFFDDVPQKLLQSSESKNKNYSALCNRANNSELDSLTHKPATISDEWYSIEKVASKHTSKKFDFTLLEELENNQQPSFSSYLDKILLVISIGYLCFILWTVFGKNHAILPISLFSQQKTISQSDVEFIDYMQRSLATIDRQLEQKSHNSVATTSKNQNSETVYVPVYTPTQTTKSHNKIALPQLNNLLPPPPPSKLSAIANPHISNVAIKSPPPPSEIVANKTQPVQKSTASSKITATAVVPEVKSSLIGIVELKEGSAALFKINGITQRIWLGEKIKNTNWTLDSIVGQKAIISNQQSKRTLGVGESF